MNPIHGGFFRYTLGEFFGGVEDIPWEAPDQLLPLERFEHPNLHRKRSGVTEAQANAWAQGRIGKACAGLRRDLVCTAVEIRGAIQRGAFTHREHSCFAWTLSGIPSWYIHEFYTQWRHSMYELARALTVLWEGNHPLSRWLNLWGENPERALPEPDGLADMERARHRGYPWPWDPLGKDMPILAHDPWVKAGRKREIEVVGGSFRVGQQTPRSGGGKTVIDDRANPA